jgi:hypothetical protein
MIHVDLVLVLDIAQHVQHDSTYAKVPEDVFVWPSGRKIRVWFTGQWLILLGYNCDRVKVVDIRCQYILEPSEGVAIRATKLIQSSCNENSTHVSQTCLRRLSNIL